MKPHLKVITCILFFLLSSLNAAALSRESAGTKPFKHLRLSLKPGALIQKLSVKEMTGGNKNDNKIKPDSDKDFWLLMPAVWFETFFSGGPFLDFFASGRKLRIAGAEGDVFATYLLMQGSLGYGFNVLKNFMLKAGLGYFVYENRIKGEYYRYISTRDEGPYLGIKFSFTEGRVFASIMGEYAPKLTHREGNVYRGSEAKSSMQSIEMTYGYDILSRLGISTVVFYRVIETSFSGASYSNIMPENKKYKETHYGFSLALDYRFGL